MDEKEKLDPDEIIKQIDQFMEKGGGHMNIDVFTPDSNALHIQETKSSECNSKNMACQVPTLSEGLDGQEI